MSRILIINDLAVEGGAEIQHWREFDLLKSRGHEVCSLTFDEKDPGSGFPKYNIPIAEGDFQKLVTRASAQRYRSQIDTVVKEVKPELVHVNNVFKAPLALYESIGPYPCLQTIRDYGAICPKSTCILPDYFVCQGECFGSCGSCGLSVRQRVKGVVRPRIERARREAIDAFVSPSQALADACTRNGMPTACLRNPFDFRILPKRRLDFSRREFLYYGLISEAKGVGRLFEAFVGFAEEHVGATLTLAGRVESAFRPELERMLEHERIDYLGILPNERMLEVIASAYCVVVPSLWIENYPNTVLEPLASEVLVAGSNRGGIPELIQDSRFLFDVTDRDSIIETLDYAYGLSEGEYRSIVSAASARVRRENSLDGFYDGLMRAFERAVEENRKRRG